MRSLRRHIRLNDKVGVDALFTPHLFSFKDYKGLDFTVPAGATATIIFETYADILYAAALNAWVLDGHGEPDAFTLTRGDFHEYMASSPKAFAEDVAFAVEALTGKTMKELTAKADEELKVADDGKKKASPLTGWLSRLFS